MLPVQVQVCECRLRILNAPNSAKVTARIRAQKANNLTQFGSLDSCARDQVGSEKSSRMAKIMGEACALALQKAR